MKSPTLLAGLFLLVVTTLAQQVSQQTAGQPTGSSGQNKNTNSVQAGAGDTSHVQDEAAIGKMLADGDAAWNRQDAKALASHRAENSDHINVAGKWGVGGREQFATAMTDWFKTHHSTIARSILHLRFITPEVAILIVRNRYSTDQKTWDAISTGVLHKIDGEWWNEAFQNTLVQSREEAIAQAARASSPMLPVEPEVITPANSKTDFSSDVSAIRKMVADGVDAWNRNDVKAGIAGAHLTEDYDHINITAHWSSGKDQTEKTMNDFFSTRRLPMASSVAKIRFITPDVAIVISRNEYQHSTSKAGGTDANNIEILKSIATTVFRKINGEWWNEAFQNTYVQPAAVQSIYR
jgi:uncharacterized protein (TIGR02246 family)